MTQEERQLLLKDLCARLPYGVICKTKKGDGHLNSINQSIFGTEYGININPLKRNYFSDGITEEQDIKPYLRPMSSMTEEERKEYEFFIFTQHHEWDGHGTSTKYVETDDVERYVTWLNRKMFDYCGLIPMGLALEAKDGMYKI